MRHRLIGFHTGMGNPDKVLLDNKGTINSEFAGDALKEYFENWEYLDYKLNKNYVNVGVEPAYQYEKMRLISINRDKNKSSVTYGKAMSHYGSKILSRTKFYESYKRNSKFKRFVDKWHPVLFPEKKS